MENYIQRWIELWPTSTSNSSCSTSSSFSVKTYLSNLQFNLFYIPDNYLRRVLGHSLIRNYVLEPDLLMDISLQLLDWALKEATIDPDMPKLLNEWKLLPELPPFESEEEKLLVPNWIYDLLFCKQYNINNPNQINKDKNQHDKEKEQLQQQKEKEQKHYNKQKPTLSKLIQKCNQSRLQLAQSSSISKQAKWDERILYPVIARRLLEARSDLVKE